ncbi:MAG: hypothetical protein K0U74_05035 [Alphaproteobacteria bacterium]|nr:hypothetical protein [Alphaproteobacteria bacterium]
MSEREQVFDRMEQFYNPLHRQLTLGCAISVEFEAKAASAQVRIHETDYCSVV